MFIINLPPQSGPHLLPLFNELPLVALNKISTLQEFQRHWMEEGREEAEGAGNEGEGAKSKSRGAEQGDSDNRDSPNAGSATASALLRTTSQHQHPWLASLPQNKVLITTEAWAGQSCPAQHCVLHNDLV